MNSKGYGRIQGQGGAPQLYAHRVSYEHHVGPIPEGLTIDHLCRNRGCVNPAHLEPVTSSVNARRSNHPSFVAWRASTCKRGHDLTGAPVYAGSRKCRQCNIDRAREWRRRNAA